CRHPCDRQCCYNGNARANEQKPPRVSSGDIYVRERIRQPYRAARHRNSCVEDGNAEDSALTDGNIGFAAQGSYELRPLALMLKGRNLPLRVRQNVAIRVNHRGPRAGCLPFLPSNVFDFVLMVSVDPGSEHLRFLSEVTGDLCAQSVLPIAMNAIADTHPGGGDHRKKRAEENEEDAKPGRVFRHHAVSGHWCSVRERARPSARLHGLLQNRWPDWGWPSASLKEQDDFPPGAVSAGAWS